MPAIVIYTKGEHLLKYLVLVLVWLGTFGTACAGDGLALPIKNAFSDNGNFFNAENKNPQIIDEALTFRNDKYIYKNKANSPVNLTNYALDFDVKFLELAKSGELGIDFNYLDENNYYRLSIKPSESKISILQKKGPNFSLLKSKKYIFDPNIIYKLKHSFQSNGELYVWLNETRIIWEDETESLKIELKKEGTFALFSYLMTASFSKLNIVPNDPPFIFDVVIKNNGDNSMQINWKTSYKVRGEIAYDTKSHPDDGSGESYRFKSGVNAARNNHSLLLTDLKANTKYYYKLRAISDSQTTSKEFEFITPEVAGVSVINASSDKGLSIFLPILSFIFTFVGLIMFLKSQSKDLKPEAEFASNRSELLELKNKIIHKLDNGTKIFNGDGKGDTEKDSDTVSCAKQFSSRQKKSIDSVTHKY